MRILYYIIPNSKLTEIFTFGPSGPSMPTKPDGPTNPGSPEITNVAIVFISGSITQYSYECN